MRLVLQLRRVMKADGRAPRYIDGKAFPKDVYKNDKEYFADVAKAYQVELDILYKAGLRNVQFDDPNLACKSMRDPPQL